MCDGRGVTDVAVAPIRLAANAQKSSIAAVIDDGIRRLKSHGMDLQADGAVNTSLCELMAFDAKLPLGRMHELMVYRVTLGEILAMAAAADTEARLWQKRRRRSSFDPSDERAQRAMSELHAYYLLGAGHALINIVARCIALDVRLHQPMKEVFSTIFPPGRANTRKHTLELNEPRVQTLQAIAAQADLTIARRSVEPLTALISNPDWQALRSERALDFHQLRPASHGVAGPQAELPWKTGDGFAAMDISIAHPHSDNLGLADQRAETCRASNGPLIEASVAIDKMFRAIREYHSRRTGMLKINFA
jgi:hypothetical protein